MIHRLAIAVAGLLLVASGARAADPSLGASFVSTVPDHVGVGAATAPDYLGSDDYIMVPVPTFRVDFDQRYVGISANEAYANVLDLPNLRAGPVGYYWGGRYNVADDVVNQLPGIADSIALGAMIGWEDVDPRNPRRSWGANLSLAHDVTGVSDGMVVNGSLHLFHPAFEWLQVGGWVSTTWASGNYMDTYFSITPQGSAYSGLPTYTAEGGFRDVGTALIAMTRFAPDWYIGAGFYYQRLVGDAADSPVVADRGSANQWYGGLGIAYSW